MCKNLSYATFCLFCSTVAFNYFKFYSSISNSYSYFFLSLAGSLGGGGQAPHPLLGTGPAGGGRQNGPNIVVRATSCSFPPLRAIGHRAPPLPLRRHVSDLKLRGTMEHTGLPK